MRRNAVLNMQEHPQRAELRDKNVGGISRRIDGQWTQADMKPAKAKAKAG